MAKGKQSGRWHVCRTPDGLSNRAVSDDEVQGWNDHARATQPLIKKDFDTEEEAKEYARSTQGEPKNLVGGKLIS